jgi:hypothetical protein
MFDRCVIATQLPHSQCTIARQSLGNCYADTVHSLQNRPEISLQSIHNYFAQSKHNQLEIAAQRLRRHESILPFTTASCSLDILTEKRGQSSRERRERDGGRGNNYVEKSRFAKRLRKGCVERRVSCCAALCYTTNRASCASRRQASGTGPRSAGRSCPARGARRARPSCDRPYEIGESWFNSVQNSSKFNSDYSLMYTSMDQ